MQTTAFDLRPLLGCLLTAALAAPAARAQAVIADVSPDNGTLGSVLTITGSGFGSAKPKVFLQAEGAKKKYALKVTAFADDAITAEVRKAVQGDLTLNLQPKIKGAAAASAAFTVNTPGVTLLNPTGGLPNAEIQLTGTDFGNKKLKVLINGKKAKVLTSDQTSATFRIPKSVPSGEWMVEVQNKIGEASADTGLVIIGSNKSLGPDVFKAKIRKKKLAAAASNLSAADNGSNIAFDATRAGNPSQQLSVVVPFFMGSHSVPKTFKDGEVGGMPIFYIENFTIDSQQFFTNWSVRPGELPWNVTITGRSGDRLVGTLEATLELDSGPGETMLEITDGQFVITP